MFPKAEEQSTGGWKNKKVEWEKQEKKSGKRHAESVFEAKVISVFLEERDMWMEFEVRLNAE